MDKELKQMCNTLLDEMGRMEGRLDKSMDERFDSLEKRMDRMESRMDSMWHDINACKLERDTLFLVAKRVDRLEQGCRMCN